jgi:WD40 repeat protein
LNHPLYDRLRGNIMTGSAKRPAESPRVFISYARADGEEFARALRLRLEAEGIPLWQDRIGMEGGRDWWHQITDALDIAEFMVLVMTPAAIQSPIVHKEWRYARQQGVCVYPVKAVPDLDFGGLPRWMRDVHFYDLDHEWLKFTHDLNTHCEKVRVPFMALDQPVDFVPRPNEFEELIAKLLDERREEPFAITAALRGAGGYGKTTLATALCHDERIQQAFDDGILWVSLGKDPDNLVGKIEDLIYTLSSERPGYTDINAATAHFVNLLADRDILLVIDDVWNAADLQPFCQGGKRCARLITTRDDSVLPLDSQHVQVDAMGQDEAIHLLSQGIIRDTSRIDETKMLRILASRLGEWALLLKLVNGILRERMNKYHVPLPDALSYANRALDQRGLIAFDQKNPRARNQAANATLRASFDLLNADEYARYQELAVFPEDVDIPLITLQKLWGVTGEFDDFDTEDLCERLHRLSLLFNFDPIKRTIRLHDVVRTYLRQEAGPKLSAIDGRLLDAYRLRRWADLSQDEPYLWDYLVYHLINAGRGEELMTTVKDLRYLVAKTLARTAYAVEVDLIRVERYIPTDLQLRLLKRNFALMSHLFRRCTSFISAATLLHSRLTHINELADLCRAFERELSPPYLTSWHALPDLAHPALIRTLRGHTGRVRACAVSPAGDYIVSASDDATLKVWDAQTGAERLTLLGHTSIIWGCAVSPSGNYIVSASGDTTLKVWDAQTGAERLTLLGHTGAVYGCAISPNGRWIISISEDGTRNVWDAQTGKVHLTLPGHGKDVKWGSPMLNENSILLLDGVWDAQTGKKQQTFRVLPRKTWQVISPLGQVISPLGNFVVLSYADTTLDVCDAQTGAKRLTLRGHGLGVIWGCAVSPQEDYIVSASGDTTLKVWDAQTGELLQTLWGHRGEVRACAVSPDGDWIVSASDDGTLKAWDARVKAERPDWDGPPSEVTGCAASPRGEWIVSVSADGMIRVWDIQTGKVLKMFSNDDGRAWGCAVSPTGDYIVTASETSLKVWSVGRWRKRRELSEHVNFVVSCAVSPTGDYIVSTSGKMALSDWPVEEHTGNCLRIWDAKTGRFRMALRGHTSEVSGCAVSPSGDYIVSASADTTLKVWNARTGEVLQTLRGHDGHVWGCAVSPSGDYIVSASGDTTLKIWDARTGETLHTLHGHTSEVRSCAVSPQGNWIVSVSADGMVKGWNASTGTELMSLQVEDSLETCAFHPDSEHLIVGGRRGLYFLRVVW